MDRLSYVIPGFRGYSSIKNINESMASSMQNFEVRSTSLKTRKGSLTKIPASGSVVNDFMILKTKAGVKYFLGAEGANIWKAKSDLSAWDGAALKANCTNSDFLHASFMDKLYMGNGTEMLYFDGSSITTMTNAPKFNTIVAHKNRLWSNDSDEPTFVYYTGFDTNMLPTALNKDNYMQISEDNGDVVKGLIKCLTHLLVINEFSTYAIYGYNNDTFNKVFVSPVGTISRKSIADVNGAIMWLSYDAVYEYLGSDANPVSFNLGKLEDIINTSYMSNACGIGFSNCYWLAVASKTSTTNDIVLIYDTLTRNWDIRKYPFSIVNFCVDGNDLYCTGSDKKVYELETGTKDDNADITSNWVSDALDFGRPGRKKKIKNIAIEMGEIAGGGVLNVYIKQDNGNYSTPYAFAVPTDSPGKTVVMKVNTSKFYNITIKLETTACITIDNISFGAKAKDKVK